VTRRRRPTVAVVGGGIAGLAAAWELMVGSERDGTPIPEVHVFEADDRLGGKLRSAAFAGREVDLAADAFLGRRPEATELCHEIGVADQLVPVGATGASIWARGRLRAMPDGLNLGVPTRWLPLARSGILGPLESLRVARDVALPHFATANVMGDRSVGEIVVERLGRPIVDRLVDPLVGGINAGSVDDLSAAATFPALIAAAHQPGSFMHRLGRARSPQPITSGGPDGAPPFWSLAGTTASLADRLAAALEERGVRIHTGTRVDAIDGGRPGVVGRGPGRGRWSLVLAPEDGAAHDNGPPVNGHADAALASGSAANGIGSLVVDGVVIAVPATEAAVLLAPYAPVAAGMLSVIDYASVAVVTLSLPANSFGVELSGTGFLVPRTSIIDDRPALVTGCTYLGRKWPHLARPDEELIRASVGRFGDERHQQLDDDELQASVRGELATILGLHNTPLATRVTRWEKAFPQYRPGHLLRVAKIEEDLAGLDGIALAGAALRGVGIPACIGSGRAAARRVLASVSAGTGAVGGHTGTGTGPEK
jgi:oxygen-dependent protoporphyrinogen oxidase